VVDTPPVTGAALLALDALTAPPAAEPTLRAELAQHRPAVLRHRADGQLDPLPE
jgi:hypothetical protein